MSANKQTQGWQVMRMNKRENEIESKRVGEGRNVHKEKERERERTTREEKI